MLAIIPDPIRRKLTRSALLICAATALASCAAKEKPPLIADPSSTGDSALPWNQQQKWEREAGMSGLVEQRR